MSENSGQDPFIKTVKIVVGIGVGIGILIALFFLAPTVIGFLFGFADAAPTILAIIILVAVLGYFGIRGKV